MAFGDSLTVKTGVIYDRLDIGSYIQQGTTLDQPSYLTISNRGVKANPTSPPQYTIKYSFFKNSAVIGAADNVLNIWTSLQAMPQAFTQSEIEEISSRLPYFFSGAPLTRLLRGDR